MIVVLIGLAIVGLAARICLAVLSVGSDDIGNWYLFAEQIDKHGLAYLYQNNDKFNNPPLISSMVWAIYGLSESAGLKFTGMMKLPMIAADVLAALLLWEIWKRRRGSQQAALAVAAYGLSLISIVVTGYHGNTDSLCVMLCLLAAYLVDRRLPLAAGLALAAAVNVKLIPLLLVPAFGLAWRSRREMLRFGVGLSLAVVPFLPFVACCGGGVYRNVVAYNSLVAHWGIMLFLSLSADNMALAPLARQLGDLYVPSGRFVIMGCILALSVWNMVKRRWNAYQLGAICFSIFLVFTPGFGVQYLIYVCPMMFAIDLKSAAVYSTLAGIFPALIYYSFWDPAIGFSLFVDEFPMPSPLFGLLVWMLLIQFLLRQLQRAPTPPTGSGDLK